MRNNVCYIYVLRSLKNKKRYIGFTKRDPSIRLREHNNGSNIFTRGNRPFVLLYSEKFSSEQEVRRRERFLKTGQGRKFLDTIIPR
ncbi:MAG: GIY-YIG nuclease family protein [Candidatus Omnitrophota bacterium]